MPWTARGAMAVTRGNFGGVLPELNGLLWAAGGQFATAAASNRTNTDAYDPVTGTWTAKAAMPEALRGHAMAAAEGYLWTFGGITTGGLGHDRVHRYNPGTNTWDGAGGTANLPSFRYLLAAAKHPDGRILLAGGQDDSGGVSNKVLAFDPVTLTTTVFNTIVPSDAAYGQVGDQLGLAVLDGYLYSYRATFHRLNLTTGVWQALTGSPGSMIAGPNLVAYYGGLVLLGGGSTAAIRVWHHRYDASLNTWTRLTDMPVQRNGAATGFASSTGALVVAGGGSNGLTSTMVSSTSEWAPVQVELPATEMSVAFELSTYADAVVEAEAAVEVEITTSKRLGRFTAVGMRTGRIHPIPFPGDDLWPSEGLYPGG